MVDLRYADFASPKVEIHSYSIMGGQTILVPPELNVDLRGVGVMGMFDQSVDGEVLRERRACESAAFRCGAASASSARNAARTTLRTAPKQKSGGLKRARPIRRSTWLPSALPRAGGGAAGVGPPGVAPPGVAPPGVAPLGASPRPLRADCQPGIPLSTPRLAVPNRNGVLLVGGVNFMESRTMFWVSAPLLSAAIGVTSSSSTTGATDVSGLEPDLVPEPSSLPAGEMSSDVGGFEVVTGLPIGC